MHSMNFATRTHPANSKICEDIALIPMHYTRRVIKTAKAKSSLMVRTNPILCMMIVAMIGWQK